MSHDRLRFEKGRGLAFRNNGTLVGTVFPTVNSLSFNSAVIFCAFSFLIYSVSCLTTAHMKQEFVRYGLSRFRALTGLLQLLGVAGLVIGFKYPAIGLLSAGGLSVQMLLALAVRRRIQDSLGQCLPAFFFWALTTWLAAGFFEAI